MTIQWRKQLLCAVSLLALTGFSITPGHCDERKPQKRWSAKWEELWTHGTTPEKCSIPFDQRLASTADVVALALMRTCESLPSNGGIAPIQKKHHLQVFLLEAKTGKVLAKYGPASAVLGFELFATASGNFLLKEASYSEASKRASTSLRVVSSDAKIIHSVELQQEEGISRKIGWEVFLSPTGKTVIAVWYGFRRSIYKVLDADTLALRTEWESKDAVEPEILSASDAGLLGVKKPCELDRSYSTQLRCAEVLMRGFDSHWRELSLVSPREKRGSLLYAFLTQDTVAKLEIPPNARGLSSATITIFQTSGSVLFTRMIKESPWYDLWADGHLTISSGGDLLAIGIGRANRFLETFDMYPRHTEVFLFRKDNLQKVMRLDSSSTPSSFCLSVDGSAFVILSGNELSSYIVPSAF